MNEDTAPVRGIVIAMLLSGPLWAALLGACWLIARVAGGGL